MTEEFYNGYDYDTEGEPCCPKCGSYQEWEDCWKCGGEGGKDGEELIMEDPLWYDADDWEECDICNGNGGWWICSNKDCGKEAEEEEDIDKYLSPEDIEYQNELKLKDVYGGLSIGELSFILPDA